MVELLTVMTILSVLFGLGLGFLSRVRPGEQGVPGVLRARIAAARNTARATGAPAWVRLAASGPQEVLQVELSAAVPLAAFSFGEGGLQGLGLQALLEGGKTVLQGRFGPGLGQERTGAPAARVATEGMAHLRLDRGFLVRLDVQPHERAAMGLCRYGPTFSLGLDGEGRPWGGLTLRGAGDLPGRKLELRGPLPLALHEWATVELSYDGARAALRVEGRVQAELREEGRCFWKPDEPILLGDAQAPLAGVLDEFRLFGIDGEEPEALPAGVRLLAGEPLIRFAAGGELDPELHPGPARLRLELPGGRIRTVEVTRLGVVQ